MGALIVFYIVLISLFLFLQWKVALLRSGKIEIETVHRIKSRKIKVLKQTINFIAHKLKVYLHKVFIKFAVWRMKTWAKIKRFIELRLPGLYMFFAKRPDFADKHFKNFFWRSVIEYKYKMKKLKAQIREEEVQKITTEEPITETPVEVAPEPVAIEAEPITVKKRVVRRTLKEKTEEPKIEEPEKPKRVRRKI